MFCSFEIVAINLFSGTDMEKSRSMKNKTTGIYDSLAFMAGWQNCVFVFSATFDVIKRKDNFDKTKNIYLENNFFLLS